MRPQAPERELLIFQPNYAKIATVLCTLSLVISLVLVWGKIIEHGFRFEDHFNIIIFLIGAVVSALTRIHLTTQRIIHSFGPFFRLEMLKEHVTDIYIAPSPNYLRLTQRDSVWTKNFLQNKRSRMNNNLNIGIKKDIFILPITLRKLT